MIGAMNSSFSKGGYVAAAIGVSIVGIGAVHANEADLARSYGWLQPITSCSKGRALSPATARPAPSLTTKEMVVKLKEDGLPVAAIAEITGVERKTVYAWLSGGAVRSNNYNRIESIYKLLQEGKTSDLRSLYRFWNRKSEDGKSLSMALQEEPLNRNEVRERLVELWPLAEKQHLAVRVSSTSSTLKKNPFLRESREVGLVMDV